MRKTSIREHDYICESRDDDGGAVDTTMTTIRRRLKVPDCNPSVQIYLEASTVHLDVYKLLNETLYDDRRTHNMDKYMDRFLSEAKLIDDNDDAKIRLSDESISPRNECNFVLFLLCFVLIFLGF